MISILFTTLVTLTNSQVEEYICRLSWYENGKCVYHNSCTLMKKFYKA